MSYLKKIKLVSLLFLSFLSFNTFADVIKCAPASGSNTIQQDIIFDIKANNTNISTGTELASTTTNAIVLTCDFTGQDLNLNHVYFKNLMQPSIKSMLINSGVTINQTLTQYGDSTVTITNPVVPNIDLLAWPEKNNQLILIYYKFSVKKGANPLRPFDTGLFLLGTHVNKQNTYLGGDVYIRIVGNLTLLCPAPAVSITSSNGGTVGFGAISPKQMDTGGVVSRTFNIGMAIPDDCETGLNVSVRFEPNNNTILGEKYLDMGNGLQTVIKNNSTELNFNQPYVIGEIKPFKPITVPYSATLSKIPGQTITPGPFSKTVRVIVSY
ncbi:fimbrial protein [Providencia sp. Me31A]|uniref:fimbrial protein n=1 Tax=Providencia sp. Me31A TaxID=3392637 RepID=UPI003D27371B